MEFKEYLENRYKKCNVPLSPALTYSDVCIEPSYSDLESRSEVNTTIAIGDIRLTVPLVASNFPFVDGKTAVLMALHGGMAVISRDLSIEEEVKRIQYVKQYHKTPRYADFDWNRLFLRNSEKTLEEALVQMKKERTSILFYSQDGVNPTHYILWTDCKMAAETGKIQSSIKEHLRELSMKASVSKENLSYEKLLKCVEESRSHVVLVKDQEKSIGFISTDYIFRTDNGHRHALNTRGELVVSGAVGARDQGEVRERTQAILNVGVDAIFIDVAHGDSLAVKTTIQTVQNEIKGKFENIPVIAGNIATPQAAEWMLKEGVHVKVGIGPGRTCKTRTVSGVGVPQLKAVIEVAAMRDYLREQGTIDSHLTVMADGGFQGENGNIVKAIVAGADWVMRGAIGRMLEPPTERIIEGGIVKAQYFGNGSLGHQLNSKIFEDRDPLNPFKAIVQFKDEGERHLSPVKQPISVWLALVKNSLQIGGGYIGASKLSEFSEKGKFIYQTQSGMKEGLAGSKR